MQPSRNVLPCDEFPGRVCRGRGDAKEMQNADSPASHCQTPHAFRWVLLNIAISLL